MTKPTPRYSPQELATLLQAHVRNRGVVAKDPDDGVDEGVHRLLLHRADDRARATLQPTRACDFVAVYLPRGRPAKIHRAEMVGAWIPLVPGAQRNLHRALPAKTASAVPPWSDDFPAKIK